MQLHTFASAVKLCTERNSDEVQVATKVALSYIDFAFGTGNGNCDVGDSDNGSCTWQERHGCQSLVMIGDGATDLEAREKGGADMFIGYATSLAQMLGCDGLCVSALLLMQCNACRYGGVVRRPKIAAAADWYIHSFRSLIEAL